MRNKGFTLIELIIVITIIGILSSVTMTSMASYKKRARDVSAKTQLKNIRYLLYMCDQGGSVLIPPLVFGASSTVALGEINGGGKICTDSSVADGIWPDLSKYGWWYYQVSDNVANDSTFLVSITNEGTGGVGMSCTGEECNDESLLP